MKKFNTLISILLLSTSGFAADNSVGFNEIEEHIYIGAAIGFNRVYAQDSGLSNTNTQDRLLELRGILGYRDLFEDTTLFHKDISLDAELRLGTSVGYENYANVSNYSFFLKPKYKIKDKFNIYGLVGIGQVSIDGTDGHNTQGAHSNVIGKNILDETSFQWGLGMDYEVKENLSFFIDYTSLLNDAKINSTLYNYDTNVYDELSSDVINIGLIYKFQK